MVGAGIWRQSGRNDASGDPAPAGDAKVALPHLPTAGNYIPGVRVPPDEAALRKKYQHEAETGFAVAQQDHLLPMMKLVCDRTGMAMPDLLALAQFESSMGRDLHVKVAAGSSSQTASGIMQITEGTFKDYAENYTASCRDDIMRFGGTPGRKLLEMQPFFGNSHHSPLRTAAYEALRIALTAQAEKDIKARGRDRTHIRLQAAKKIDAEYSPHLIEQIGLGRDSPFISMLFAARHAQESCATIDPEVRAHFKGAEIRLMHMFRGDAQRLFKAYKETPDMRITTVFGLDDIPVSDKRWNKIRNNGFHSPDMQVRDFIDAAIIIYDSVRSRFATHEKDWLNIPEEPMVLPQAPLRMAAAATQTSRGEPLPLSPQPPPRTAGKPTRRGLWLSSAPGNTKPKGKNL
jgi:hypothetical protein